MGPLDERYIDALQRLVTTLEDRSVTWALTGSTSFALQGVPLTPNDIDVQTTENGAYVIEEAFEEAVIDPVTFAESEGIRSHFGVLELEGIRVEVMGAVQKRRSDGTWESPVAVSDHRTFVEVQGNQIPVLTLEYEAKAYEQLGRSDRAELLATYADS